MYLWLNLSTTMNIDPKYLWSALSPTLRRQIVDDVAAVLTELAREVGTGEVDPSGAQGGQDAGEKQMSDEMEGGHSKVGNTIKGEVLRVEGDDNYFVKGQDGKEVRLHTDKTTQMLGEIKKGDRIEAKVNDQNHLLSIRSARGTDAGNGKEEGRDSLGEVKN